MPKRRRRLARDEDDDDGDDDGDNDDDINDDLHGDDRHQSAASTLPRLPRGAGEWTPTAEALARHQPRRPRARSPMHHHPHPGDPSDAPLAVVGTSMAILIPETDADEEHGNLVPWAADAHVLLSRFDARHLLGDAHMTDVDSKRNDSDDGDDDDLDAHDTCHDDGFGAELHAWLEALTGDEALLNRERYADLLVALRQQRPDGAHDSDRDEPPLLRINPDFGPPVDAPQTVSISVAPRTVPPTDALTDERLSASSTQQIEEEDVADCIRAAEHIPIDMQVPRTARLHALIHRTAAFVRGKGPQMEILLKAREANNPALAFLNHNHAFAPYYRAAVHARISSPWSPDLAQVSALYARPTDLTLADLAQLAADRRYMSVLMRLAARFCSAYGEMFSELLLGWQAESNDPRLAFLSPASEDHREFIRLCARCRKQPALSTHDDALHNAAPQDMQCPSNDGTESVDSSDAAKRAERLRRARAMAERLRIAEQGTSPLQTATDEHAAATCAQGLDPPTAETAAPADASECKPRTRKWKKWDDPGLVPAPADPV
jgi:hypothetical protein